MELVCCCFKTGNKGSKRPPENDTKKKEAKDRDNLASIIADQLGVRKNHAEEVVWDLVYNNKFAAITSGFRHEHSYWEVRCPLPRTSAHPQRRTVRGVYPTLI